MQKKYTETKEITSNQCVHKQNYKKVIESILKVFDENII